MSGGTPERAPGAASYEPSVSKRVWIFAAFGAIALHAACIALAAAHLRADPDAEDLGAAGIEIGLEMLAPRFAPSELPPGPETEASTASPAVAEQKEVVEKTDLPTAVPDETAEPQRVVAVENTQMPKDEVVEVPAARAAPSTESIAVEATAPPTLLAAREAPQSVVAAQGTGEDARRARETWQKALMAQFNKHKRYPSDRTNGHAEIVVTFALDRAGHILSAEVSKSSGDLAFDQAALAMVRRSDPVPPPPPLVADEGLSFTVPVIFRTGRHD